MTEPDAPVASEAPVPAPAAPDPALTAPVRCPRCGADLAPEQDWCLSCGTAARTVIAATPRWRTPIVVLAVVVVLFGAAVAWAFVALTDNDAAVQAATTTAAPASTDEAAAAGG